MTVIAASAAALLCGALGGCSFVLDSSAMQCKVDSDCDHFGDHPKCVDNVCVLGPPGCVLGTLSKQSDFLNQCTTSTYKAFNNCDRIGYCDETQPLPMPTPPSTGKIGSSQPPPAPQNLCTEGAPTDALGNPQMIWITGSGDFSPLLRAAQPLLTASGYRGVFQSGSSCQGVSAIYNKQSITDPATETNGGWPIYFDAGGNQVNCRLGPVGTPGSKLVDIGISDVFSKTCGLNPVPGVNPVEYSGPVVAFVFATKAESTQESISAEAAHMVFGLGGMAPPGMKNAAPWTDYHNFYLRSSTGGSTIFASKVIGVDRTAFWGIDRVTIDNLAMSLKVAPVSDPAIGILSMDFYDTDRGNLKALYLQNFGQSVGYLPDSTPTTTDRVNIRDGHYTMWGYVHFVAALDPTSGLPSSAANALIVLFNQENLKQEVVDSIIATSEAPQCAMKVERTDDIGDYKVRHGFSCGCYFDFKTQNGKTDCQSCKTADDCPGQAPCNYGFCEVGSTN